MENQKKYSPQEIKEILTNYESGRKYSPLEVIEFIKEAYCLGMATASMEEIEFIIWDIDKNVPHYDTHTKEDRAKYRQECVSHLEQSIKRYEELIPKEIRDTDSIFEMLFQSEKRKLKLRKEK
ncbi:MAG: hypothetical protein ACOYT4_00120 [Nanoarchaeota archaeon]